MISTDEGHAIAKKLHVKKILSDSGTKELLKRIDDRSLFIEEQGFNVVFQDIQQPGKKSGYASILAFCYEAFLREELVRGGFNSNTNPNKENARRNKALKKYEDDPEGYEEWYKKNADRDMRSEKKRRKKYLMIEAAIPAEDAEIDTGWTIYPPIWSISGGTKGSYIHESRSVRGKTRSRTARDLFEIGLIDETVLNDLELAIKDSVISSESDVLKVAAEQTVFYYTYPLRLTQQLAFFDSLEKNGLLTSENKKTLLSSSAEFDLKSPVEIVSYCEQALVVEVDHERPFAFPLNSLKEIQKIVPDFNSSNLKIKTDSAFENGEWMYKSGISVTIDGIDYEITTYQTNESGRENHEGALIHALTDGQFYRIVNKWLLDQSSRFRLYLVTDDYHKGRKPNRIGFVLLTSEQRELWPRGDPGISFEDHDNTFSRMNIQRLVNKFDSIGLFSHLSNERKSRILAKIQTEMVFSIFDILLSFDSVVYMPGWATTDAKSYEQHCWEFSKISKGKFRPSKTTAGFRRRGSLKNGVIQFSFELNGKKYSEVLDTDVESMDPKFIELIRQALIENNIEGQFFQTSIGGNLGSFMFLNPHQHKYLVSSFPEIFR